MRRRNYTDDATLGAVSVGYERGGDFSIPAILSNTDGYIIEWDNDSVCATLQAISIRYLPDSLAVITANFLDSDGFVLYATLEAVSVRYEPNGDTILATTFTSPGWLIRSPIINVPHQEQSRSSERESTEPTQHVYPYNSETEKIEKLVQQTEDLRDLVEKESV